MPNDDKDVTCCRSRSKLRGLSSERCCVAASEEEVLMSEEVPPGSQPGVVPSDAHDPLDMSRLRLRMKVSSAPGGLKIGPK